MINRLEHKKKGKNKMDQEDIKSQWEAGELIGPLVDIYETDDDFMMLINMPGVTKDSVEVKMNEGELSIYGEVVRNETEGSHFILKEIDKGNYYRVFRVSDSVEVTKISANMQDGVLSIKLPKHERIKPREIPIEIE
jgi:HSP20 family molecular chaperone IbpA